MTTNATQVELASAILATVKMYSDTYDHVGAKAATDEWEKRLQEAHDNNQYETWAPDYRQFQTKHLNECAREVSPTLGDPVYYLLIGTWNESIDWAERIISGK